MAADTKERILFKALEMFSENGYNGTNLRDLANELDLSKSALYRHFESKEEIWNAAQDMMTSYYVSHFGSVDKLPRIPKTTDELFEMTMHMVDFTVHDEKIIRMRKILHTEQFRDVRAKKLASNYFLYDTISIFSRIFEEMMKNGSLKTDDPDMLAFSYTTPITALIHLCDREPEMEREAIDRIEKFVNHFINEYGLIRNTAGN